MTNYTQSKINFPSHNLPPLGGGQGEINLNPSYTVRIIKTLAEFEPLKEAWDAFLLQAQAKNLCLTHGWLLNWLQHFPPKQLWVLIVQDSQEQWVGVAPFKISHGTRGFSHRLLRHLQWIGTEPTVFDWMQLVILPEASEQMVIEAMAKTFHQAPWDVLDLQFNPHQEQQTLLYQALYPQSSKSSESLVTEGLLQQNTMIPAVVLPESEAIYERARRKKTRLEVNRHCNRFNKEFGEPPSLVFHPSCEATDAILTRFFAGHIEYWAEKKKKSDFQRFPDLYGFYKSMLAYSETQIEERQPRLLFSVLKVGDYQLSYHLGFWQGDRYLSHITHFNQGFRGYSPGTIHMDKLVFNTIQRHGVEFEFGRGDEPYKKMWAEVKKPLWDLRVFRNPVLAAIWQVDILLKKALRKAASHE